MHSAAYTRKHIPTSPDRANVVVHTYIHIVVFTREYTHYVNQPQSSGDSISRYAFMQMLPFVPVFYVRSIVKTPPQRLRSYMSTYILQDYAIIIARRERTHHFVENGCCVTSSGECDADIPTYNDV